MPISGEIAYSVNTDLPDIIQSGRPCTVSITLTTSGATVTPSAATFTLYTPGQTAPVLDAVSATISGAGVVSYNIAAAVLDPTLSGRNFGPGWLEVWTLTVGGVDLTYNRPAALSIRPIVPTVSDDTLLAEHPDMIAYAVQGTTTLQTVREAAWGDIVRRWLQAGGSTWNIADSGLFHEAHRELSLSKFWRNTAKSQGNESLVELGESHRKAYEAAWTRISVQYDRDQDGRIDDPDDIEPNPVVIHRSATRATRRSARPWHGRMVIR